MKARSYLNRVFQQEKLIEADRVELAQLRLLATSISATEYGKEGGRGESDRPMERSLGRIMELEEKIQRDIDQSIAMREEVRGLLGGLGDNLERAVMQRRYLCMESWESVARVLGMSERHVYRLHGEALKKLDKKISKCH